MAVGPLFTVFSFLLSRTATVSTSDILFFLCLGLYFVVLFAGTTTTTEVNAILQNLLEITLFAHSICLMGPIGPIGLMGLLMVEQTNTRKRHSNAVLVAGHDDVVVTYRATSLGNELDAALVGTLDVVAEGEEGVRA